VKTESLTLNFKCNFWEEWRNGIYKGFKSGKKKKKKNENRAESVSLLLPAETTIRLS